NSPSYVLFSPNQSDVNDENIAYLGEVLEILRDNPSIKLEIIGRADMQGSEEYNLELSQKRADAVQLWFSDNGIDRNRMSVISKGKSDPVASNKTQEGMALNRSAQIILKL
ncbi:MAG: OmpA family protein, partial [Cryomorphaceae bacterium]